MVPRFTPLDQQTLTEAQRQVIDEVRAGRRGTVPANVVAWLPHPDLARRAAHLGELVRYGTSLPPQLSELAILVVARHWSCGYEWAVHASEAARAGVPDAVIAALGHGETPSLSPRESVVLGFARELMSAGRVTDATWRQAMAELGETGVVDLVAVVGYYTFVAFTLNAREVPVPPDAPSLPPRPGLAG
jgi:4-carboxymuconolactone decarboxylase